MRVAFAIPGDLATPTGGYAYARRLIREAPRQGIALEPLALPDGFPRPTRAMLSETAERLGAVPGDRPVLIDGLALGVLPGSVLDACASPIVALCHHPLALETGVAPEDVQVLRDSERAALARCAAVITTSHATAEILASDYGVPGARVTVAQPGTDPAPRAATGGPGCRILSVGSLTRRKGHDRLIRALARIEGADWSLRIVGPARDPRVAEELANLIADEGLEDRVVLAGEVGMAELAAAYQSADLFALASAYEGFGMAFAEAMAHGLPVLGLTCPAVEEATAGAARLVDERDFARELARLIRDTETRADLAERCWTAAQTLLRWPQTMAIVAGVLRGVTR